MMVECNYLRNKGSSSCPNNIILPIKPFFADQIISGQKKYEYRKQLCKNNISNIYIYSTSPVKAIIGEVVVLDKLKMGKKELWIKTEKLSGITREFYDEYFRKQSYACAYYLGNAIEYETPIALKNIGINYSPQSFIYCETIKQYK